VITNYWSTSLRITGVEVYESNLNGEIYIKGAKVPQNESSREREGLGAKRPGNERARERKFQGANRPGSYWPIRSGERIGPGAKRLGTNIICYL